MEKDRIDRFLEQLEGIPDLDYEVEGIVDRISSLDRHLKRSFEETLAERGLTRPEWQVLRSLHLHGIETCSPGELCSELELSSGAMTNRLDRLERAGLIRRRPDPDDRRGVQIELTEAGSRAWVDSTNAQAVKEARVASALTKAEQARLNALLRKLMLEFDRVEGGATPDAVGVAASDA